MTFSQTGYVGTVGPVFVSPIGQKYLLVQGIFRDNKRVLIVKPPEYSNRLRDQGFPIKIDDLTMDMYIANQDLYQDMPAYKSPPESKEIEFGYYGNIDSDWIDHAALPTTTNPVNNNTGSSNAGNSGGNVNTGVVSNDRVTTSNRPGVSTDQSTKTKIMFGVLGLLALVLLTRDND